MTDVATQAADWIVRLTGDDPAERARAEREFAQWKDADPRHAAVAARMERLVGRLGDLQQNGQAARSALVAAGVRRRRARRTVAATIVGMLALSLLALQPQPVAIWLADLRTSTGEWQTHTLADGSRLLLGSDSAVDIALNAHDRIIKLRRGSLLVDVAPDAARPFRVETTHGTVQALGTRFAVVREEDNDWTRLDMLESRVGVRSGQSTAMREVEAGQSVRIYRDRIGAPQPIDALGTEQAWRRHQLVVNDAPLADALEQLARHRRGMILFDRDAVRDLRVSAVLPLDDTDRALQLLAKSFPVLRVDRITPWVVTVARIEAK